MLVPLAVFHPLHGLAEAFLDVLLALDQLVDLAKVLVILERVALACRNAPGEHLQVGLHLDGDALGEVDQVGRVGGEHVSDFAEFFCGCVGEEKVRELANLRAVEALLLHHFDQRLADGFLAADPRRELRAELFVELLHHVERCGALHDELLLLELLFLWFVFFFAVAQVC